MNVPLTLYIDGEPTLEVARGSGIPGQLRALFARLDADMCDGVELDGSWIPAPDDRQRRGYIVQQLLGTVLAGRPDFCRSLLIYLAFHWPELRAVRVRTVAGGWDVELEQD